MKRIGIITKHSVPNYGAMLQAHGLVLALQGLVRIKKVSTLLSDAKLDGQKALEQEYDGDTQLALAFECEYRLVTLQRGNGQENCQLIQISRTDNRLCLN